MLSFNELMFKHVLPAAPSSDIENFKLFFWVNTNFYLPADARIFSNSGYIEIYYTLNKQTPDMPTLQVSQIGTTVGVILYVDGCLFLESTLSIENEEVRKIVFEEALEARYASIPIKMEAV